MRHEFNTKTFLAVVAVVLGCFGLTNAALNGQNHGTYEGSPVEDEVRAVARRVVLRRLVRCGQSLYAYAWIDGIDRDYSTRVDVRLSEDLKEKLQNSDDSRTKLAFGEYRGIIEGISLYGSGPKTLSLGERLNGVEWHGRIDFKPEPAGRSRLWENGEWGSWDREWTSQDSNPFSFYLTKKNRRWFVGYGGEAKTPIEEEIAKPQPSCAELPIR